MLLLLLFVLYWGIIKWGIKIEKKKVAQEIVKAATDTAVTAKKKWSEEKAYLKN